MINILEARNLTVTARLRDAVVPAIRDLSFNLPPGKILGLVGESGAGKSMVGHAIAQLLPPGFAIAGGALRFEQEDLIGMAAERRRALLGREIAFVPQAPLTALNPVITVGRQFDEHLARLGRESAGARRARAIAMLTAAHLRGPEMLLARYPHQLSGGMCQRVLIAMAFASDPSLVIADEPTTALDVTIHVRIIDLIAEMQRQHGTALIFITHDLRLAAQICDEILVMYAGRVVERGPAKTVLSAPAHPYTRCLQLANPSIGGEQSLYVLPEQMPSLRELASFSGCRFAPRCPLVSEECRAAEPTDREVAAGHAVACIRPELAQSILAGAAAKLPVAPAGTPLLRVEGLAKHYSGVIAARDVSFAIAESELVALVGESGSGKSTVARLIAGLDAPSAGRIFVRDQDITRLSGKSRALRIATIQMVFQDPQSALNPRRRVASIVTQVMEAGRHHTDWDERIARARELLAEMGLSADIAMRFPAQLSGGQRQRINIARALCAVPKLLVADEIVSGLDVSVQAQLINLLLRLRAELGFAMLFISHDLSVVRHLCSRVLVMYRGEIVEQGLTEEVFSAPRHAHTQALLAAVPPDDPRAEWPALRSRNHKLGAVPAG